MVQSEKPEEPMGGDAKPEQPVGGGAKPEEPAGEEKKPGQLLSKDAQSLAGVISALGLIPILIVIIGRLWTTEYFDYVGLPCSGLEFDVYDYAFRSREVLIGLFLGAIGFSTAWLYRVWLADRGATFLTVELVIIPFLVGCAFRGVDILPQSWHTSTGILGLSMGLPLAAMAWFCVDVWQGPGEVPKDFDRFHVCLGCARKKEGTPQNPAPPPAGEATGTPARDRGKIAGLDGDLLRKAHGTLLHLLLKLGWMRQWRDSPGIVSLVVWRVFAVLTVMAIGSLYLPRVAEELARVEAAADVATGRFAGAILESKEPLPPDIASSADTTKSRPVRVILSQSQNTYVLHSTSCVTVGGFEPIQARVAVSAAADASDLEEAVEVCKVFTIPTERLKSIEYFHLGTKEAASESVVRSVEVGLGDEPSQEVFSSEDASDEEKLVCETEEKKVRFYNSLWYEFTPPADGTVLVRVQAAGFRPVVGVWKAPQEGTAAVVEVTGSGERSGDKPPVACETTVVRAGAGSEMVGVVANVDADTRYLTSVGSQKDGGEPGV